MNLIQILLLFILFVLLLGVVVFHIYMIYSFLNSSRLAPYVPSPTRDLENIIWNFEMDKWKHLVDLWCGDGKALRFFQRNFGVKCDGFDINIFPLWYGRLVNKMLWYKNISLIWKNFLKVDLAKYDYVYLYLLTEQLADIEDWIFWNIKISTVVITNTFRFKDKVPFKIIKNRKGKDRIFFYKV